LEDWSAKGVPYRTPDALFQDELQQTAEKIRTYQQNYYYGGEWRPDYDRWVEMLVTFTRSSEHARVAWVQALISEMIYTQPVVYEFNQLKMPTLLIIGQRDRTAPGRELAPEAMRMALGNYSELGSKIAATIPEAKLVPLESVGHLPHIEAFSRFITPLKEFLASASDDVPAP
jgi:pimeloyl-ACP methyl ester carboxylesterase